MTYKVSLYLRDVRILRPAFSNPPVLVPRGECATWSWKSRQRLRFVGANTAITFRTLLTVTYPREFPSDGVKVKKDIHALLCALWRFLEPSRSLSYLWFFEFQKRGAPHVHFLINRDRCDLPDPAWLSATWYRIVGSNDPRHLAAGTRIERLRSSDAGARYAVKYAQKTFQKDIPEGFRNVGRFWAHSRDVAPCPTQVLEFEDLEEVEDALRSWPYYQQIRNPFVKDFYGAAVYLRHYLARQEHLQIPLKGDHVHLAKP